MRFSLPFAEGEVKTQAQVEALALQHPGMSLPPGVHYTSGIYSKDGVPYVLVWVRDDDAPPTQLDMQRVADAHGEEGKRRFGLDHFSFDVATLRGSGDRAETGGLHSRIVFQVARGATVFVGYYYEKPEDAAGFDQIASSFSIAPERTLRMAELKPGSVFERRDLILYGVIACVMLVSLYAMVYFYRRIRSSLAAQRRAASQ